MRDSRCFNSGTYFHKVPSVISQGPQSLATQITRNFHGRGSTRLELAKNLVGLGLLILKLMHFLVIIGSELEQF
jgi:hypothetical protein